MPYELKTIKRAAARGKTLENMDVHESVIYYTLKYCYGVYADNPTESVRRRLKEFSDPVIEFHYGRKNLDEWMGQRNDKKSRED